MPPLPTPSDRSRRRQAMVLVVLLVGVVVAVVGGGRRADAASCAETVPAGQIRVVVVVDPGDGGGPSAVCLVVPAGTTGSQVLARRAAELGREVPRYAGSGLLCAIDGYPAPPACGDRNAGGFRYWAYFNGSSGGWVYGNYNPFIRRLSDGDIEGWRFVDGAGNGSDPPPRIEPSRSLFPAIAAPPAPVVVEPSAAAPSGAAPGAVAGGGVAAGPTVDPGTIAGDAPVVSMTGATTVDPSAGGDGAVELTVASVGARSDGTAWLPVAVVVGLIAALGAGAVVRARNRG